MEDIARHAGVGVGTLYRRFPTRPDLIGATFESKMTACAELAEEALAAPQPWPAFCRFVERVCEMQAQDCGFAVALTMALPDAPRFEAERDRAYTAIGDLIGRCQSAGELRADFVLEDLVLLLIANAGVIATVGDAAPELWRRLAGYMVQAFGARNTAPLPPGPPPTVLYKAFQALDVESC
jgi:AcrR family transcriptional regulator